ncbi:DUF2787 family protein [Vibrio parahaemolyticus]|nr:DUF2787 family protein [Vibrio parahaemolyticus]NMS15227.1 DUF2787 family protein [Vibrio parahaemolyticus]NMS40378.1 DUF2787 family protein [Vibrio parahaemolyticus]NMS67343.1 DUF2787 family protein [Vibrio parahaemolyticus]NMU78962.1 DUF2787 family protein [Vibrio parahaemolyticus]
MEDLYRIWEKSFIKHVREGSYDEIKVIL